MSSIKLFYKSPLSTWQSIFKFFNDGTSDITTNNSSLFTEQGLNFIGDNFSTSSFSSIGLLYTKHNSTTDTYVSNKIIDISNTFGNTTDPVAALDFITYLSAGIFGSPDMIDFFSNTTDISTSYGDAIETCCSNITNNFATQSDATTHSNITSSSGINLKIVKQLYDAIQTSSSSRFTMSYGATVGNGTPIGGVNQSASGSLIGTGATVDVIMNNNNTVQTVTVNTTGSNYVKHETVTITTNSSNTVVITLTDVQAKRLNGTLGSTSGTELPLMSNDVFHILLSIKSSVSQSTYTPMKISLRSKWHALRAL